MSDQLGIEHQTVLGLPPVELEAAKVNLVSFDPDLGSWVSPCSQRPLRWGRRRGCCAS
jgi:hypothetical protein